MTHWVRYERADGTIGFGTLDAGRIAEFTGAFFSGPSGTGKTMAAEEVRLLSPCLPGKIIALFNNFHALAAKLGKPVPAYPLYFIKPAQCVAGPDAPIRRPARYGGKIVFEGELGIVIGRTCSNVSLEEAAHCVFGFTCVNDVTAVELLDADPDFAQWTRAKSFDTFGLLGPVIASALDLSTARVVTRLDGVERQNYPLSDMVFAPAQLVSLISGDMTLQAGDVIACGTSLGVGSIKDGSTVQVSIDGIGTLSNRLLQE